MPGGAVGLFPAAPPPPQVIFRHKPADTPRTTDIILSDDPDLVLPDLVAGRNYKLDGFIISGSASLTPDIKMKFISPGHTIGIALVHFAGYQVGHDATGQEGEPLGFEHVIAYPVANEDEVIRIKGILINATAGTFSFQWSQRISSAIATTVRAGSWLSLEER